MVTKTDPFLLFVPSCCFSWFCYPSQAVCLLLVPWGTRNRAKKSSGNLSENTPLKKHKIKGSRPSQDDFWVQKWVPKGESIGLLGVFFNTLGPLGPLRGLLGRMGLSRGASKPQNGRKVTPQGPQSGPKIGRKWSQDDPKKEEKINKWNATIIYLARRTARSD